MMTTAVAAISEQCQSEIDALPEDIDDSGGQPQCIQNGSVATCTVESPDETRFRELCSDAGGKTVSIFSSISCKLTGADGVDRVVVIFDPAYECTGTSCSTEEIREFGETMFSNITDVTEATISLQFGAANATCVQFTESIDSDSSSGSFGLMVVAALTSVLLMG